MDCGFFFAWIMANLTKMVTSHINRVPFEHRNHSGML